MDKQDKPLSEWTLGEVQALCEKRNGDGCCDGCPFANVIGNCTLRGLPEEWDLKEAPRLTEQEIAIMRAVGAKWVSRDDNSVIVNIWSKKPEKHNGGYEMPFSCVCSIDPRLFPSVHPGECIAVENT